MTGQGVKFDPRTKMLLLLTMAIFVLGGAGSDILNDFMPLFCAVPLILFLLAGQWKSSLMYLIFYSISYGIVIWVLPMLSGLFGYIMLAICGIITRFLPSIMTGAYLMQTTTVSEFSAAMNRMHVTEKITIPLSVMFRFFPTIGDEFTSINDAMRMRDIRFGGKNVGKMVEYRMIPLMVCSARIGEELNAAAITRGLGGEVKRTNVCRIGLHVQDYILILACLVPYVVCVVSVIQKFMR